MFLNELNWLFKRIAARRRTQSHQVYCAESGYGLVYDRNSLISKNNLWPKEFFEAKSCSNKYKSINMGGSRLWWSWRKFYYLRWESFYLGRSGTLSSDSMRWLACVNREESMISAFESNFFTRNGFQRRWECVCSLLLHLLLLPCWWMSL